MNIPYHINNHKNTKEDIHLTDLHYIKIIFEINTKTSHLTIKQLLKAL